MDNAGAGVNVSADRTDGDLLIGLPAALSEDSGTVTTDVEGGCDFKGRMIGATKIHKHLHRDANLFPAHSGSVGQLISIGPGGQRRNATILGAESK
jgi:hypothetical protein